MTLFLSLLAAASGLGLGEAAWGISTLNPEILWPQWTHGQFLLAGALVGLSWAWVQSLGWRLAFGWDEVWGLRIGAFSLLPAFLGFAWSLALRQQLPPPHDFPLRNLELLLAAIGLLALFLSAWMGLAGLLMGRSLDLFAPRSLALRLGGLSLVFYLLGGAWAGQWNSTGDAPHYVLMAHSLLHDHDLDLANNYDQGHWKRFYDRPNLERQLPDQPDGRQMPEHKVGVSLVMLPGYALFGMSGARLGLGAMAAAGGSLFFLLCLSWGFSRRQALWGWALLCLSAPWLTHAQLGLVELMGGFLILLVYAAWQGLLPRAWALIGCAGLFWVSVRFYPLALALAAMDAWSLRKRGWPALAAPLVSALSLGLALWQNHSMHGGASPAVTYAQRDLGWSVIVQPLNSLRYAGGLLIDQEYGWLPYVPVYVLSFFGLFSLWQRDRTWFWLSLLPSLAYLGPIVNFPWWFSGMAPNRYLICLAPAFAFWTLEAWRSWGSRTSFNLLAAFSMAWAGFLTLFPWYCWGRQNGQNMVLSTLESVLKLELTDWFPGFARAGDYPVNEIAGYVWLGAFLLLLYFWFTKLGAIKPQPGH